MILSRLRTLTTKQKLIISTLVIVGIILIASRGGNEVVDTVEVVTTVPSVTLSSLNDINTTESISVTGSVRPTREVELIAERGGRLTRVNASLGRNVFAGQVIFELENASERAALLQAEGTYEAAVAGAASSDIGVTESEIRLEAAKDNARTAIRSAYTAASNAINFGFDPLFSQPMTTLPGLRISGRGDAPYFNSERVAWQTILVDWQISSISVESDVEDGLTYSLTQVDRLLVNLDKFISLVFDSRNTSGLADIETITARLTADRTNLNSVRTSLTSANSNLQNATENLKRAEISASEGNTSASDAQLKQALGVLRAAEANLAKTVVRTPISGTVQSLDVQVGAFVNASTPLAIITNITTLEIVTFLSDAERDRIKVGTKIDLGNNQFGQVAAIAPALDERTRKTEVRITASNSDLKSGDTVRVTLPGTTASSSVLTSVPLTAVKIMASGATMFTVEDGELVSLLVTLGAVRGSFVNIESGLMPEVRFVTDARGKNAGDSVTITN